MWFQKRRPTLPSEIAYVIYMSSEWQWRQFMNGNRKENHVNQTSVFWVPCQFSRVKLPCCFFWTSPKAGGLGPIRTLPTAKVLAWFLVIVLRALIPHQAAGRTQLINNLRMEMGGTSSKAEFGWEGPCYFVMLLWNFRRFLFLILLLHGNFTDTF